MNKRHYLLPILLIGMLSAPIETQAQVRSGLGFLKLSPGARQVGIAGSLAGTLDFTDSFYANPAATGLLREWQWSASYTNWITDVYNASFLYGRQVRTPWSRWTKIVAGFNYLGIPDFDSSEGASPLVSGSNVLAAVSIGQPLTFVSDNLSFGTNIKYFRAELGQFDGNAAIFDMGLLYRTPRFKFINPGNDFLDYAILSFGAAVTNLGQSVTFESEATPLPRTLRAGAGLNLGSHNGLQIGLSGEYRKIRDEDGFFSFGSEISWSQLVSLRMGYSAEDNLLGDLSFGASFRLDDQTSPVKQTLPGRNNALRFDLAANQSTDLSSSPFHGTMSHIPIGPEGFRLLAPSYGAQVEVDSIDFAWESSVDRDLYDEVHYWLVVDPDSTRIANQVVNVDRDGEQLISFLSQENTFLWNQRLDKTEVTLSSLPSADYFWAVFAFDTDRHIRFADLDGRKIGRFRLAAVNLQLTDIRFEYSPWITGDSYQGMLLFDIVNHGQQTTRNMVLSVVDSSEAHFTTKDAELSTDVSGSIEFATLAVPDLEPGASTTLQLEWQSNRSGLHHIIGQIRKTNTRQANTAIISRRQEEFWTIPKGSFTADSTVLTQRVLNTSYELPYVGKVFFDSSSTEIPRRFLREWLIEPLLVTLAKRLHDAPERVIRLQGTADPNSGETDVALAYARAEALRDSLLSLGVTSNQIEILEGQLLPPRKLPQNPQDVQWLLEERRRVDILTDDPAERVLFGPVQEDYNETKTAPVSFHPRIFGSVPFASASLRLTATALADTLSTSQLIRGTSLEQDIVWQPPADADEETAWTNLQAFYSLALRDSLNRDFATRPDSIHFTSSTINRERMYFGVAKFAVTEPLYNFYWDNLLERMPRLLEIENARLRFVGHACAIGPEQINMTLSQKRAQLFYERFLTDVKSTYPGSYLKIKERIDPPVHFGESQPFTVKARGGRVLLLGDNNLPTGRQLNRRVMALIYWQD